MARLVTALLAMALMAAPCVWAADGNKKPAKKAQRMEQLFKKLDANNDGKLSLDEFRKITDYLPKLKDKPKRVEKLFAKLDRNNDGFVTLEEIKSGTKKK